MFLVLMFVARKKEAMIYSGDEFTIGQGTYPLNSVLRNYLLRSRGLSANDIDRLFQYNCLSVRQAAFLFESNASFVRRAYRSSIKNGQYCDSRINAARVFYLGNRYSVVIVVDKRFFEYWILLIDKKLSRG